MMDYAAALAQHNDRGWFHENHRQYEQARADWLELLDILRFAIAESAPALANDILYMQAKDWVYRVARDMRYCHDCPPYDPAFRAYIAPDRKSWQPVGYFLRIFPGSSCFGTGLWCENTAATNLVRDYLCEHLDEWQQLVEQSGLTVDGDRLKKLPRGYAGGGPADEWIRYKNWELIVPLPDEELTSFQDLDARVRALVLRMEPLRLFLLHAVRSRQTPKQILQDFYR